MIALMMNPKILTALAVAACTLLAACNKSPQSGGTPPDKTTAAAPKAEEPDASLPEVKVTITGNDQMKFDVTSIEAKPRQKVTVTMKNGGTMPKISMGHNFVLLRPGTDPAKFVEAGAPYMGKDSIAPETLGDVIAHTKLLGPAETDTISFAAPTKPGEYTYICSFPGHYAIGMKGTLIVK
jgi:azurin